MSNPFTPFLEAPAVEHEVAGASHKFFPVTTRVLFQLRGLAKPLARALSSLLTSRQQDVATESVDVTSTEGRQLRTTIQAIDEKLARARQEQRDRALTEIIDQVMADSSASMIALLVMDSMRDAFPKPHTPAMQQQFVDQISGQTLVEMLVGVGKANKKLFDPLKDRVAEAAATLRASVRNLAAANGLTTPTPSGEA